MLLNFIFLGILTDKIMEGNSYIISVIFDILLFVYYYKTIKSTIGQVFQRFFNHLTHS